MELFTLAPTLQTHPLFEQFTHTNPQSYLAHLFFQNNTLQVGYYVPTTHSLTTFSINNNHIERTDNQEILHKETAIIPLDIAQCTITPEQAKELYHTTAKKLYPKETTTKLFIILQQNNQGPHYNITGLTLSFKTLNIQLSAITGNILTSTCEELAQRM